MPQVVVEWRNAYITDIYIQHVHKKSPKLLSKAKSIYSIRKKIKELEQVVVG